MDKVALVFPGSGTQYVGMGKKLYDESRAFKDVMDEANDSLHYDLKKICFDGGIIKLNKIENMLVAIFAVSVGIYRTYMEEIGIKPTYMAGHSLGEFTALCCGGALEFGQMIQLVRERSILAKKARDLKNGTMSIMMDVNPLFIKEICSSISNDHEQVVIACYNSPSQVMISGTEKLVLDVEKKVIRNNGKVIPIVGSAPYHSPLMKGINLEFENELNRYKFRELDCFVMSNVTALPYKQASEISNGLLGQMTKPVLWQDIIKYFKAQDVDTIIELGPQQTLKMMIGQIEKNINTTSYIDTNDREQLKELKKMHTKINEDIGNKKIVEFCRRTLVTTKNYNLDLANNDVLHNSYRKFSEQLQSLSERKAKLNEIQIEGILELLMQVLLYKKLPTEEYTEIIRLFKQNFS